MTDRILEIGAVTARPKTFKTGSTGYYVWGKVTLDGKQYQFGGNLVLVHSKPKTS